MSVVEIERDGPVARVWLNRPDRHNALVPELAQGLVDAFAEVGADDAVRVVVLGGRGPSFCAGADITTMKASANATFDENLAEAGRLAGVFAAVAQCPKPVICRAHGNVFGGGVGLVCASDLPVASDDAKFGLTEVRLGILPSIISAYVVRRLGDANARELMLTGERFDAAAGLRYGLVQHVVPADALDAKVAERVEAMLAGAPRAQERVKELLGRYGDHPWKDYNASLPRTLAEVRGTDEARDGLAAFFEKRKPKWMEAR